MTIPRYTFFEWFINGGRGINADQVDWSVTDPDLNALLATLTGAGNTAFSLTAAPAEWGRQQW